MKGRDSVTRTRKKLTPFGKEVEKKLIDLDMTKKDLSNELGITQSYLTDVLKGTREGYDIKPKIAKLLELDLVLGGR